MSVLDKTLEAADEFKAWFTKTMMNADGNFDHLPDWLTEDMRRAWDAGRASTTSAGVTEEQTPRVTDAMVEAACAATVSGEDEFGKPVHLSPAEARCALEASRVAPVSQKEAVPEFGSVAKRKLDSLIADGWAVNGYALIKGEERRGFIDFGGFVGWWLPEYYQNHTSDAPPAPAVEPVGIKALDTRQTCQGNGEIVTDWDTYLHGDDDEHATAECPDCNGIGKVSPTPVSAPVGGE